MLRGEDSQWEDINEFTDKEAKEGGTETTAKKLMAQGMMNVRRIMFLQNGQVGLTQSMTRLRANGNIIASMKVIRYGLSFRARRILWF